MRFSLQPVHATGRYFYLSLVEILQREFGYPKVYSESTNSPPGPALTDIKLRIDWIASPRG